MKEIKTAVILGGGLAAFDSFSIAACPKFLLPIANRPLFHYLAACLTGAGVERLIFCVTPNLEKQVEAELAGFPPTCQYLVKETSLGSGGSLKEVAAWIKDGPFWVAGGDLLLAEDLTLMLARHQARGAMVTVASLCQREAPLGNGAAGDGGRQPDQGDSSDSSLPGTAQRPEARRPLPLRAGHSGGHSGGEVF